MLEDTNSLDAAHFTFACSSIHNFLIADLFVEIKIRYAWHFPIFSLYYVQMFHKNVEFASDQIREY